MKFIFDLDGTITSQETLPLIAKSFGVEDEINELTSETIQGNIPFVESFIKRVHVLGKLPVLQVEKVLESVLLYDRVVEFILNHREHCIIATGNLDCWIDKLAMKIGCRYFASEAEVRNDRVVKITRILRKEHIVEMFQKEGETVVFIGDGNNDMEAMRQADVSIATGMTHHPAKSILPFTDYLIFNENSLCRQLNLLYSAAPE